MKAIRLILFVCLLGFSSFAQTKPLFAISEAIDAKSTRKTAADFKRQDSAFFEDETYIVRKTCQGEWGGSIWFKNKQTGIEYSCTATCPVVVNKLNGKYIVSNTLAHLSGFSDIIEISKPDSMDVFEKPKTKNKNGKKIILPISSLESQTRKGTVLLVDSFSVLILASFPYNGELYHIVTDFTKTYVSKLEKGKLVTIAKVSDQSIWTYEPEVIRTTDNHYVVVFDNEEVKGYLDIVDNRIKLVRYK